MLRRKVHRSSEREREQRSTVQTFPSPPGPTTSGRLQAREGRRHTQAVLRRQELRVPQLPIGPSGGGI